MAIQLIYETHATSTDNEAGIATGWLPGALSDLGRAQARELGGRRKNDGLSAIFSSDLARAVETAQLAFGNTGLPRFQDSRLRECNYGEWNGTPVSLIAAERRQRIDVPFPGGQSYRDVVAQTRGFLRDLLRDWNGTRVLVIAHSANRWALEHLLHGVPLEDLVDAPFQWQEGWEYTLDDGKRES